MKPPVGRYHTAVCVARFFLVVYSIVTASFVARADVAPREGIAMHGTPKYKDGFEHFDYVNPSAPKGGELRLGIVGTFDSMNPFIVRGTVPQTPAFGLSGSVYESLMARSWDEPFSLYGLIAKSVEVPNDRSEIIFNIRENARWQDGKPITADDVLFSFETLRDKGRPNHRTYYKKAEKAEKLSPRRVRFAFKKNPDGSIDREMPLIMGLMPILPKHYWQGRDFNQPSLDVPLGSGPYKITKVEQGRSVTYERIKDYWAKDLPPQKGMYNFDSVRFDYYRDDGIALQAFKAGQFDLRREPDPNKWALSYQSRALSKGDISLSRFEHKRTEAALGFIINTRKALFKDATLRKAMELAFDFEWINRALFHGLYRRTKSFFPNSELAATGSPKGLEKEYLEKYHAGISPRPIEEEFSGADSRTDLLKASELLKNAGYELRGGNLFAKDGTPISFEILLSDPAEEKVALEWSRSLRRLGISAKPRTVDSSQFQARLTEFDYDAVTGRWFNSLSPGNEQIFFWGSQAASQNGSRNYAGIMDKTVDELANAIPAAKTREELVAATRALDRVLLSGHYVVPLYHLGADQIAYWQNKLEHPSSTPLYGPILESWWGK